MTLGGRGDDWPYNGSIDAASSFGNELVESDLDGIVIDEVNNLVTAPAYMKGPASFSEVYDNVKAMVDQVAQNVG
jgi:enhancing lycopene biosynthesis protein 2